MIEITASEPRRHIEISVGELLIGRVTRIEGKQVYEVSVYDSEEDCYGTGGKLANPTWEPYTSFGEAIQDLLEHCGYGALAVDRTITDVNLMKKVTL